MRREPEDLPGVKVVTGQAVRRRARLPGAVVGARRPGAAWGIPSDFKQAIQTIRAAACPWPPFPVGPTHGQVRALHRGRPPRCRRRHSSRLAALGDTPRSSYANNHQVIWVPPASPTPPDSLQVFVKLRQIGYSYSLCRQLAIRHLWQLKRRFIVNAFQVSPLLTLRTVGRVCLTDFNSAPRLANLQRRRRCLKRRQERSPAHLLCTSLPAT